MDFRDVGKGVHVDEEYVDEEYIDEEYVDEGNLTTDHRWQNELIPKTDRMVFVNGSSCLQ